MAALWGSAFSWRSPRLGSAGIFWVSAGTSELPHVFWKWTSDSNTVQVTEEMEIALCKWWTFTPLCEMLFAFPDDSSQSVLQACTYWIRVHWIFSLITTKMLVCSCVAHGSFRYASAVRKYVVIKLEGTWTQLAPGSLLQGCLIISFSFFFP